MRDYSDEIVYAIKNHLEEDQNFRYSFDDEEGIFDFGMCSERLGTIKRMYCKIIVFEKKYVVYVDSAIGADPSDADMMARMAEFVCRANNNLLNGNFELDFNDGEVKFKTFVDCSGLPAPTGEIVRNSIITATAMFIRYSRGITQIVFDNDPADDVVAECEEDDAMQMVIRDLIKRKMEGGLRTSGE